jgi:hypothetical protein
LLYNGPDETGTHRQNNPRCLHITRPQGYTIGVNETWSSEARYTVTPGNVFSVWIIVAKPSRNAVSQYFAELRKLDEAGASR